MIIFHIFKVKDPIFSCVGMSNVLQFLEGATGIALGSLLSCAFVFLLILLIRTLFTVIGEIFLESFRLYKCQMLLLSPLLMGLRVEREEEGRA